MTGKVGDVALTVLHEVCHVVCGGTTAEERAGEDVLISFVECSYMEALCTYGIEFSDDFKLDASAAADAHDPNRQHRVELSEIVYRWVRGLVVQW